MTVFKILCFTSLFGLSVIANSNERPNNLQPIEEYAENKQTSNWNNSTLSDLKEINKKIPFLMWEEQRKKNLEAFNNENQFRKEKTTLICKSISEPLGQQKCFDAIKIESTSKSAAGPVVGYLVAYTATKDPKAQEHLLKEASLIAAKRMKEDAFLDILKTICSTTSCE